jgi:hypothetical protein
MPTYEFFLGESRGGFARRLYIKWNRRPAFANMFILASREARRGPDKILDDLVAKQRSGFSNADQALTFAKQNFPNRSVLDAFCERVRGWKSIEKDDSKTKVPSVITFLEPWATIDSEPEPLAQRIERVFANLRPEQRKFHLEVFLRYGEICAMCSIDRIELLEAAHLHEFRHKGPSTPENGLPLCRNHHRAFDCDIVTIDPNSFSIFCQVEPELIGLTRKSLLHLKSQPSRKCLESRYQLRKQDAEHI